MGRAFRMSCGSGSSTRSTRPRIRARAPGSVSPSQHEPSTSRPALFGSIVRVRGVRSSKSSSPSRPSSFCHRRNRVMRLLIVDDDADLRQSLTVLLRESGYEVAAEADPEEALRRALAEDFDLILCDVRMPRLD